MGRPQSASPLADQPDHLAVLGLRAVGEVQPRDVHARRDEPVEHGARAGGGADGADDLGSPHRHADQRASARARYWPV